LLLLITPGCKTGPTHEIEETKDENPEKKTSEFEKIEASFWSRQPKLNLTETEPQGLSLHSVSSHGNNILLIKVSEFSNIDYIRWKACPTETACLTGISGSPYTYLTSLPVGNYQVQASLCIRGQRSETGKESCTSWSEIAAHEQVINTSTQIYAYFQVMNQADSNILALGGEIVDLSKAFINRALKCPDSEKDYINKLAAFTTLGAIVVGDQVSRLNPKSISQSSEGLFLAGGEDEELLRVQKQLSELGDISTKYRHLGDFIRNRTKHKLKTLDQMRLDADIGSNLVLNITEGRKEKLEEGLKLKEEFDQLIRDFNKPEVSLSDKIRRAEDLKKRMILYESGLEESFNTHRGYSEWYWTSGSREYKLSQEFKKMDSSLQEILGDGKTFGLKAQHADIEAENFLKARQASLKEAIRLRDLQLAKIVKPEQTLSVLGKEQRQALKKFFPDGNFTDMTEFIARTTVDSPHIYNGKFALAQFHASGAPQFMLGFDIKDGKIDVHVLVPNTSTKAIDIRAVGQSELVESSLKGSPRQLFIGIEPDNAKQFLKSLPEDFRNLLGQLVKDPENAIKGVESFGTGKQVLMLEASKGIDPPDPTPRSWEFPLKVGMITLAGAAVLGTGILAYQNREKIKKGMNALKLTKSSSCYQKEQGNFRNLVRPKILSAIKENDVRNTASYILLTIIADKKNPQQ